MKFTVSLSSTLENHRLASTAKLSSIRNELYSPWVYWMHSLNIKGAIVVCSLINKESNMIDEIKQASSIQIENSSKERVAFELAKHIAALGNEPDTTLRDRKYWLTLYCQCLKATTGYPLSSIMEKE
jgi:hypothetical protein